MTVFIETNSFDEREPQHSRSATGGHRSLGADHRRCAACGHIGETVSLSVRSVGQLAGTAASSEARTVAADRNRLERAAG